MARPAAAGAGGRWAEVGDLVVWGLRGAVGGGGWSAGGVAEISEEIIRLGY